MQTHGFRLVQVHALDWDRKPALIAHWLRHQLGKSERVCQSRAATRRLISPREAKEFFGRYHLQGYVAGRHFGLVFGGRVVAAMTFAPYQRQRTDRAERGVYLLAPFAAAGNVPGAAGRLFRYAIHELGAARVWTFSDDTYAQGSVYKRLGFVEAGRSKPEYQVFHPQYGWRHKDFWEREALPIRVRELKMAEVVDLSLPVFAVIQRLGCVIRWDMGKGRWRWERSSKELASRVKYQITYAKPGGQPGNQNARKGTPKAVINIRLPVRRGGTSTEYLLRRLARRHPAVFARWEAGEFRSARAAAIAAGVIRIKDARSTPASPAPEIGGAPPSQPEEAALRAGVARSSPRTSTAVCDLLPS